MGSGELLGQLVTMPGSSQWWTRIPSKEGGGGGGEPGNPLPPGNRRGQRAGARSPWG